MMKFVKISALVLSTFTAGAFIAYKFPVFETAGPVPTPSIIAPTPAPTPIPGGILLFTGDIMLSRSVGAKMVLHGDYTFPFARISDYLKSADLAFGNLENPVSDRGIKVGSIYSFRADPRTVQGLKTAGFDVVSIANNHMWDYGRDAFTDTLMHLRNNGIDYVGGGNSFAEAHDGVIKEINGVKIGFLAYTDLISSKVSAGNNSAGVSYLDIGQMEKDIKAIRGKSDLVAVSFHWGEEYKTGHNKKQEQVAISAIEAGADLIIGHHPHVVQEVEKVTAKDGRTAWIAYSLGNFVFDQYFSEETMEGLILRVELENGSIKKAEGVPVYINADFQPGLEK